MRLFPWLAALVLGVAGCGGSSDTEQQPSPALWQIESADGEAEGWLFGTIHALPDGTEWRTPALEGSLEQSDALVVEVADLSNTQVFTQLARTEGVGLLSERVSPEWRDELFDMLRETGTKDSSFYNVEDWAAALALAQLSRDAAPGNGVDLALINDAKKPVVELEGLYRQLSIFDRLPAREQRALLDSAVERYSEGSEAEKLREYWLAGDIEALASYVTDEVDDTPLLYQVLLTDRNLDMASKIVAMLETPERPFVAVGAAHMVGDEGIPALLQSRGYKVIRIQ